MKLKRRIKQSDNKEDFSEDHGHQKRLEKGRKRVAEKREKKEWSGGFLNPEILEAMLQKIRAGSPPDVAAISCGLTREQFDRWMHTKKIPIQVEQAQGFFISESLEIISKAGPEAMNRRWMLEILFPEDFGKAPVDVRQLPGAKKKGEK